MKETALEELVKVAEIEVKDKHNGWRVVRAFDVYMKSQNTPKVKAKRESDHLISVWSHGTFLQETLPDDKALISFVQQYSPDFCSKSLSKFDHLEPKEDEEETYETNDTESHLKELREKSTEIKSLKANKKYLEHSLEEAQQKLERAGSHISRLQGELNEYKQKKEELKQELSNITLESLLFDEVSASGELLAEDLAGFAEDYEILSRMAEVASYADRDIIKAIKEEGVKLDKGVKIKDLLEKDYPSELENIESELEALKERYESAQKILSGLENLEQEVYDSVIERFEEEQRIIKDYEKSKRSLEKEKQKCVTISGIAEIYKSAKELRKKISENEKAQKEVTFGIIDYSKSEGGIIFYLPAIFDEDEVEVNLESESIIKDEEISRSLNNHVITFQIAGEKLRNSRDPIVPIIFDQITARWVQLYQDLGYKINIRAMAQVQY